MTILKIKGKKGAGGESSPFFYNWPEYFALILLVFGAILALVSKSAFLNYFIMFTSGMITGRLWYQRKDEMNFPLFLMSTGFVVGFLLGSFYGDKKIIFISFVVGFIVSQQLHKEGIIDW